MPHARSEGANIYFEETGEGTPILFLHEYAGDHRSWADQVRYFSRGYRCISMAARGYAPSDVPATDGRPRDPRSLPAGSAFGSMFQEQ
jgi:3-oxoadipate enol-lactonase